jgi:hypothetical protein
MDSKHQQPGWAGRVMALLAMALLAVGLLASSPAGHADPPVSNLDIACRSQQAELDAVNADISVHNSKPHTFRLPSEQAAFDEYNAEKAQLDARGAKAVQNLNACESAMREAAEGAGPLPRPTQQKIDNLNTAKEKVPPGYVPPTTPPTKGGSGERPPVTTVDPPMKPVFDQLRDQKAGNQTLKPTEPIGKVGDPDPSRPGATIPAMSGDPSKPAIVPDHIVPLAQMMYMPGFIKLPAEQMYMIANSPLNLQWMSRGANAIKSSGSAARITDASPQWLKEQLALENDTRDKLQKIIDKLLAAMPPGR